MRDAVTEIKSLLAEAGVAGAPLGIDIVEPPFLFELQRQGITAADAQQPMMPIVDVDDVGTGNTALDEGQMVVLYCVVGCKEIGLIAFFLRCLRN